YLDVYVQPDANRCVRFPRISPDFHRNARRLANSQTVTACWIDPAANRSLGIPNFKIPFGPAGSRAIGPLCQPATPSIVSCRAELLTSLVLTLSRYEESLPGPRDEHGRFAAPSSIAWRDGFLDRPIVDEWGLAFAEAIRFLLPAWGSGESTFRVKIG